MIHPTAIIEPGASISENVEIGAYSIVGKNVSIGIGTRVGSHSLITGKTSIGKNTIARVSVLGYSLLDRSIRYYCSL